jgi:hypothetical protein
VCTYHSIVGSSGSRPASTSAHIARSAAIGESVSAKPARPAEPGNRWMVDPNGDGASEGRQEKRGRPESARLTLSVVPGRFTAAIRDVSRAGSVPAGTRDISR